MIFQRTDPSSEYRSLRFLSETERWELGLSPYHNGTRLRMGLCGKPPSIMDFCLGHDTRIYSPILLAIMERLIALPESATAAEIDSLFPWAGTRPNLAIHLRELLENSGLLNRY